MVEVTRSETIGCTPSDWLDLVLDVHRYALVDDKIGRIQWVRRTGNLTEFRFVARLPGVALPGLRLVSQMRLDSDARCIDLQFAALPRNLLSHAVVRFEARFSAEAAPEGTRVTRMISFRFTPPLSLMVEPVLQRTLAVSVERELRLAKQLLEAPVPDGDVGG